MEGFEIVAAVHVACTDDVAGVTRDFAGYLVRYLGLPFYRAMFVASGLGDELAAFDAACARGTPPADAVAPRLIERLAAIGSEEAVRACVDAYRRAGATLPAVRPVGYADAPHYAGTLRGAAAEPGGGAARR
jgi:hypothetical protein